MAWERTRRYVRRASHAVNICELRDQVLLGAEAQVIGHTGPIVYGSSIIDRLAVFRHTQDTLGSASSTCSGTSQFSLDCAPIPMQYSSLIKP